MKVGLITTLGINIGDEFIRDGLLWCWEAVTGRRQSRYLSVHKHDIWRYFPFERRLHALGAYAVARRVTALHWRLNRVALRRRADECVFDRCDAIIQCGSPIVWNGVGCAESWSYVLWHEALSRYRGKIPILNLAGGSAYAWKDREQAVSGLTEDDTALIREMFSLASRTTVRDPLAARIATHVGFNVPMQVCAAYLAPLVHGQKRGEGRHVLLNYMPMAGHYDWADSGQYVEWERIVCNTVRRLSSHGEKVVFVCHTRKEASEATRLGLGCPVVTPSSRREYLRLASEAKCGLCNRMHAAVVLAGMGIPCLAVGNDTRMLMAQEAGQPTLFVGDATQESVWDTVCDMLTGSTRRAGPYPLPESVAAAYQDAMAEALAGLST